MVWGAPSETWSWPTLPSPRTSSIVVGVSQQQRDILSGKTADLQRTCRDTKLKSQFHTHSYNELLHDTVHVHVCMYHIESHSLDHSLCWSVSQGPPTFCSTPASLGPCCSMRSQWSFEGWTYEDDLVSTAPGLTQHTEPPQINYCIDRIHVHTCMALTVKILSTATTILWELVSVTCSWVVVIFGFDHKEWYFFYLNLTLLTSSGEDRVNVAGRLGCVRSWSLVFLVAR